LAIKNEIAIKGEKIGFEREKRKGLTQKNAGDHLTRVRREVLGGAGRTRTVRAPVWDQKKRWENRADFIGGKGGNR